MLRFMGLQKIRHDLVTELKKKKKERKKEIMIIHILDIKKE